MKSLTFLRFIVPAFCSFNALCAVSNKNLLNMGHDVGSPLNKRINLFPSFFYKGIGRINNYGWYITQKWEMPPQQVELEGKWYEVKKY